MTTAWVPYCLLLGCIGLIGAIIACGYRVIALRLPMSRVVLIRAKVSLHVAVLEPCYCSELVVLFIKGVLCNLRGETVPSGSRLRHRGHGPVEPIDGCALLGGGANSQLRVLLDMVFVYFVSAFLLADVVY